MQKIEFINLPNRTTPLNAENLNQIQTNVENEINNLQKRLLWKNQTPTNNFSAQTISVDFSNCDAYEIIYKDSNTGNQVLSTGIIPIGYGTRMANVFAGGTYIYGVSRDASFRDNTLNFTNASRSTTAGFTTNDNARCIPLFVIGYKTDVFN